MVKQLDPKQTVDLREVVISEIIQWELLEEIKKVQASIVRADK